MNANTNLSTKWLITGAGGLLGQELVTQLRAGGYAVLAADRKTLDITDAQAVTAFIKKHLPDVIINCAAYTAVDAAEQQNNAAFMANHMAVEHLATACTRMGGRLIQISTDYVFSGPLNRGWQERDPVAPLSVYGTSKLAGEQAVQVLGSNGLVVRTSWLFGRGNRHFPEVILRRALNGDSLRVVNDQTGCPTWAPDLANTLITLGIHMVEGRTLPPILHYSGSSALTWWQYAQVLVREAHTQGLLAAVPAITPVSSAEFGAKATRPQWSVLDCQQARDLGLTLSDWRAGLSQWLQERQG
ncbi:dTDP-4-dehydrorhamnose reductase [Parathalassolituus penaei]|uniref:dTDP-4-dehydrorhamnose reductase n=1 Tax=Parathalassolituus penaei TaxID=2997323 RepID=A0A9X3EHR1_9GAMM|nr:dTDP-4-dehydrorhamnose reductase [Parathalassolituus penaei]MCY0966955.1 dTDP-4-dehydrorhamnose reductase [Parathalassolituus penaei]